MVKCKVAMEENRRALHQIKSEQVCVKISLILFWFIFLKQRLKCKAVYRGMNLVQEVEYIILIVFIFFFFSFFNQSRNASHICRTAMQKAEESNKKPNSSLQHSCLYSGWALVHRNYVKGSWSQNPLACILVVGKTAHALLEMCIMHIGF